MRAVFADLTRDDMDALVSNWAEDGVYFNPSVGPAAEGKPDVKSTIATMSTGLKSRGETLVVDRVTEVPDATPARAYVEWHVEGGAQPGRLGLHVVLFNEEGLLHHVTVFRHM